MSVHRISVVVVLVPFGNSLFVVSVVVRIVAAFLLISFATLLVITNDGTFSFA